MSDRIDNCPDCGVSFIGDPIPEDMVKHYAGTHWRNEIAIDGGYMGIYDGIVAHKCHECGHEFPRNRSKWAISLFKKYKEKCDG